jgi:phosphoserine phosphatase
MSYKLLVCDIDGTLTNNPNPWLTIHHYLSTWTNLTEKYKDAFLQKEITYAEFCKLEVLHWKGANVTEIKNLFCDLKTPANLFEGLKKFKDMGFRLVAISSGLQFVSEVLNFNQFFDDIFFNEVEIVDGFFTGKVNINVNDKVEVLDEYLKKYNLNYENVIVIGDGDNDLGIFEKSGFSIAFCANSNKLREIADFEVNEFDYKKIIEQVEYVSKSFN